MRQINDLIQPRAEQILLTGLSSLSRPHRLPLPRPSLRERNHGPRFEGIAKSICKKIATPSAVSGKNHYLKRPNHTSRSTAYKYFTVDILTAPRSAATSRG